MTNTADPVRCPHRCLVLGTTADPGFRAWVEAEVPDAITVNDPVDIMVELALRTRAELKRRAWGLTPTAPAALLFPRLHAANVDPAGGAMQPLLAAVLRYLPDTALFRWDDGAVERLGGPEASTTATPTHDRIAPSRPSAGPPRSAPAAGLRLVGDPASAPPPHADAEDPDGAGEPPVLVPEISPEEIAMLLGADGTPAP